MTREEAREILEVYRHGSEDAADPFFQEALNLAARDAELGKWFANEQALDATVARKAFVNPPEGLKPELIATLEPRNTFEWSFPRALVLAAAAALLTLLLALDFLAPRQRSEAGLESFRGEMVSFINDVPSLDLQTGDMGKIRSLLAGNIREISVPAGLENRPAVGCRALIFRGYKVGLVCFKREGGGLAHLLVVDRAAFGGETLPARPVYRREGDWMTAMWTEGPNLYMLASKGGQKEVETLVSRAGTAFRTGVLAVSRGRNALGAA